jgi:hypothetical protein
VIRLTHATGSAVSSGARTALDRGTGLGQEWIGGLAQTEAGQALAELGELNRTLSGQVGVIDGIARLGGAGLESRGDIGQRFDWHPSDIFRKSSVGLEGGPGFFKDDAVNSERGPARFQARFTASTDYHDVS